MKSASSSSSSSSSGSRGFFSGGGGGVRGGGGGGNYVEMRIGARFTPGAIALLVLYGVTYLLTAFGPAALQRFIGDYLVLQPAQALGLRPYQLIVGPTLMTGFFSLLFLALLLWSIGSAIEQRVGTRQFLIWMAGASGAAALLAAAVGRLLGLFWPQFLLQPVLLDAQPVFMGSLVAFAQYYGTMPVRMWGIGDPISGRGLSYFFIGLGFVADIWRQQWLQLAAEVGAVLFMLFVLRGGFKQLRTLFPKRRRLGVMDGGLNGAFGGGLGGSSRKPEKRWVN